MYSRSRLNKLLTVVPEFTSILVSSPDHEVARERLLAETRHMIEENDDELMLVTGLQFSLRLNCARAFRQFLSRRSARVSGFDLVKVLFDLANMNTQTLPVDLSDAFLEDLYHIFAGMIGKAGVYEPIIKTRKKGRAAALVRSQALNKLCALSDKTMSRYRCGLEDSVVKVREGNRQRIMSYFNCSEAEFADYRWQLQHIIRDSDTLGRLIELTDSEKKAIDLARKSGIPFGITPYYASLFDYSAASPFDMPVRTQVIPPASYVETVVKSRKNSQASLDFMLEGDTSPIDLITRRYPHIVVFKPYNTCSQICVYCQRNWEIEDAYAPGALASRQKIDAAINWIAENPVVTEVLLTGGDPLVMSDKNISYVLKKLASIPAITRIRIGTRTPVALPQRITDELVAMIAPFHEPGRREIAIVTHFEHSYEITPEAMRAVQKFRKCGMSCYNQAVFTIQNCRRFEVSHLRRWLRLIGVEPYYTFNAKGKEETDFYRVPLARLQQEAKEEARLLPGLSRTDEPVYNVPGLGKNYLRAEQNHLLLTILPDGRRVYEFHPWEKFIANTESYVHTDIAIFDYLKKLEQLGEKAADYRSIYYYF